MINENQSVEFSWNIEEFQYLLNSCLKDESVQISLQNIPSKQSKILEAGCGSGRVLKYFSDLGYKNVYGIELNKRIVNDINQLLPELNIIQGDILKMPYDNDSFDVIVNYGVVEHFPKSMQEPLLALKNVLKPNGTAIVTVPSFNILRQITFCLSMINPLRIFKKGKRNKGIFHVYPEYGDFFEYRLTKKEFESECKRAGFTINKSIPIFHIDGLHHTFGNRLVKFENWDFKVTLLAKIMNAVFKIYPFFHNHMHLCILTKS